MMPPEKTLNVSEAARELGVSAATLRDWTNRGLVPYLRTPGGQRRFTQEQIRQIQEQMGRPTKEETMSTSVLDRQQQLISEALELAKDADWIDLFPAANVISRLVSTEQQRQCANCGSTSLTHVRQGLFEVSFRIQGDDVEVVSVKEPISAATVATTVCDECGTVTVNTTEREDQDQ